MNGPAYVNAHKPSQARALWCPLARAPVVVPDRDGDTAGVVAANRVMESGEPDRDTRCIGAGCMMWRWHTSNTGYCGLAGKPLPLQENDHD